MSRRKWAKSHKGNTLRSGFELKAAKYLDSKKVKYGYETEIIEYEVPKSKHKYKPDFILPNGVIVEAKGRFTPADRKKMSLVIEQHPELDIRMLFMLDNKLSKASNTTYSTWCEKRGIKSHVSKAGELPEDWYTTSTPAVKKRKEKTK